jgi:PAS domain S-box-containing protein
MTRTKRAHEQPSRPNNSFNATAEIPKDSALKLLFERSADATLLIDGNVVVDCNQAAVRMLHYSGKEKLLLTHLSEISPPFQPDGCSSFEKANEMMATAFAEGNHRFEWTYKRADDSLLPVEVLMTAIPLCGKQTLYTVCHDITVRKRIKKALVKQTEVFQSILDNMGDAVVVADKEQNFIVFNPAAERMFGSGAIGTTSDEWSHTFGLYLPDMVTPFPADELPLSRSIRGEDVDDVEVFVRNAKVPDGIWTRFNGRPLRDAHGVVSGGIVVCSDISERKRAEETLQKSKEKYESLVQSIDGVVWEVDYSNFAFTFVSRQAARILGYQVEQWLNDPDFWPTHVHPDDRHWAIDYCLDATKKGEDYQFEYRMIAADGRTVWLRDLVTVEARNSRPVRLRGVMVDITERKKEEAFREGQHRILEMIATGAGLTDLLTSLVLLTESQSDGMLGSVLLLDDDGIHVRHGAAPNLAESYIQIINGASIGPRAGSCGTAMYLGKQVFVTDILTDPLWDDYRELAIRFGLRACWSTPILSPRGKVLGSFGMYYREPRSPREEEIRLTEVATHIAGIAIERRRAEEELRRTQAELAHVSRVMTMGELAASIAHEVNQPLGAIVGNADICLNWLSNGRPDFDQLREALADISNDGRRASEVVARIRSLVKKSAPQKTRLDLNEVVGEVLALVRHEAQRKQVALNAQLYADLPCVQGDRVEMQQVLLNLAMNGIEAMAGVEGRQRQLTVRTARSKGDEVMVSVQDNGTGITTSGNEQLFKAFHTTKPGGMGMGLAICRSIIQAHGGQLWAEPNVGPGATFQFSLPSDEEGTA